MMDTVLGLDESTQRRMQENSFRVVLTGFFEADASPALIVRDQNGSHLWVIPSQVDTLTPVDLPPAGFQDSDVLLMPGNVVRHIKTQGLYKILFWATTREPEVPVVIYKSLDDRRIWVRQRWTMFDGRFEPYA